MALYNDLTNEQKAILASFTNTLRGWAGEQARANQLASILFDDWNAQVSAIVNSLDAGEVIPNASGLSGAQSLTKEDATSIVSHCDNILNNMATHVGGFNTAFLRQLWSKAQGVDGMLR